MNVKNAVIAFALLLSCAAAMPCRAEVADAAVDLEEAKSLYNDAQFADAIAKLQGAISRLGQAPDAQLRRVRLADAYFHLGLCYLAVDDAETARNAFIASIKFDPQRRLDNEIYAPKVIAVFEQARLAVEAATPSGTAEAAVRHPSPARDVVFGAAYTVEGAAFGVRQRPTPKLNFPGLQDPSFPIQRESYTPGLARVGVGALVCAPHHLGRLAVAYRTGESAVGPIRIAKSLSLPAPSGGDRELSLTADRRMEVSILDVTWSGRHRQWGPLTVRRELGYRYLHVNDSVKERLEDLAPDGSGTAIYDANATVRGHGVRIGAAADLALGAIGRRWHLEAGAGYTWYFAGSKHLNEPVHEYTDVASDGRLRQRVQGQPTPIYLTWYSGEREWDFMAKLRLDLGRGLSLSSGYQWSYGSDAGGIYPNADLSAHGAAFSLAYRLER